MNPILDALDDITEINTCFEAIGDLLIPEPDLHAVNRDRQAILHQVLTRELLARYERLNQALKAEQAKGR